MDYQNWNNLKFERITRKHVLIQSPFNTTLMTVSFLKCNTLLHYNNTYQHFPYLAAACHWDTDEGRENNWWCWRPWERFKLSLYIASYSLWSFTVILQRLISILRLACTQRNWLFWNERGVFIHKYIKGDKRTSQTHWFDTCWHIRMDVDSLSYSELSAHKH